MQVKLIFRKGTKLKKIKIKFKKNKYNNNIN